jgi:hypothetical protein
MEEQFRPKERVGGSSPSRGTSREDERSLVTAPITPQSLAIKHL